MDPKYATLIVFVLVYAFLALSKKYRARALWIGVLVLALLGVYVNGDEANLVERGVESARRVFLLINWDVMGIFAGVLFVAEFFILSRVPVVISDWLVDRSRSVSQAMLFICGLSSFVSIWVENVATVLIVAPLALQVSRRLKLSPVPFLIGIAITSNLQGTATLVGDPPSMILAGEMKLNFNDFFFFRGKPGIFFAVQIGAVFSFLVLWLFYRKYRQPPVEVEKERVQSWMPTILLAALIAALAVMPALERAGLTLSSGLICCIFGVVTLIWSLVRNPAEAWEVVRNYDYRTVAFLAGVFALVGALGLERVGLIEDFKDIISGLIGQNRVLGLTVIVGFSLLLSAFIDNVPYIMAMLPVVLRIAEESWGDPGNPLLAFGLLTGACLGGNITPIGASANVVAMGLLRREGFLISFWEFIRMGLPFTLAATIPAAVFLWFVWS